MNGSDINDPTNERCVIRLPKGQIGGAVVNSGHLRGNDSVRMNLDERVRDPWIFLAEQTHRIVNEYTLAISSLSIAAANSSQPDARASILNAISRLRGFVDAHRALQTPTYTGPVDLAEYLRGICTALTRSFLEERGVRLTLVERPIMLEAERCWCVGLIMSELIINAARHGFDGGSGSIMVEISVGRSELQCRVTDDGHATANPGAGHGSIIVKALAGELGGHFERKFSSQGTTALLRFPYDTAGLLKSAVGEQPIHSPPPI